MHTDQEPANTRRDPAAVVAGRHISPSSSRTPAISVRRSSESGWIGSGNGSGRRPRPLRRGSIKQMRHVGFRILDRRDIPLTLHIGVRGERGINGRRIVVSKRAEIRHAIRRHPFAIHGSTSSTPVYAKSFTLRVAQIAPCARQIAAICASAVLIGAPTLSRATSTSA